MGFVSEAANVSSRINFNVPYTIRCVLLAMHGWKGRRLTLNSFKAVHSAAVNFCVKLFCGSESSATITGSAFASVTAGSTVRVGWVSASLMIEMVILVNFSQWIQG